MPGAHVLLLGWGNATPSQLAAYERLHAMTGSSSRSVIPDTKKGILSADAYVRALVPAADELVAESRPIVVHLFSDNGFIGWAALLSVLATTERGRATRDRIRGVILDSSPGLWAVRSKVDFARRFALAMTPAVTRALGLGPRERVPVLTPALIASFVAYQLAFPGAARAMKNAAHRVADEQPGCPHLFLYGDDDALVPADDVRAWIALQRQRGLDVEDVMFPGAKHVALFPKDPRRYRETIARFVTRVT
jgi:pimeloyl-ACP methyl ester carboxylesterase